VGWQCGSADVGVRARFGYGKEDEQMYLCGLQKSDLDEPRKCVLVDKPTAREASMEFYQRFKEENPSSPLPITVYVRRVEPVERMWVREDGLDACVVT
jgi:hypothetical protein